MKTFEIYFRDLTKEAQGELCEIFETLPEEENWDVFPLAFINREEGGEEK